MWSDCGLEAGKKGGEGENLGHIDGVVGSGWGWVVASGCRAGGVK